MESLKRFISAEENCFITTITPIEAEIIVTKRNNHNRKLVSGTAASYKSQMLQGKWNFNGESIIFDKNGNLNDGQHRLYACWRANIPLNCVVSVGFPTDTFKTIDSGKTRSFKDVLSATKESENDSIVAEMVKKAFMFMKGTPTEHGSSSTRSVANSEELCKFYADNQKLFEDLVCVVKRWKQNDKTRKLYQMSILSGMAAFLIINGNNPNKVIEYIDLITSDDYAKNQTTLLVRKKFEEMKTKYSKPLEKVEMLRMGWNNFAKGKEIKRIRVNTEKGYIWENAK